MNYLVTGSAGFIGMHLCEKLKKEGHFVIGVDNLNDYYDKNLKKNRHKKLKNNNQVKLYEVDLNNFEN